MPLPFEPSAPTKPKPPKPAGAPGLLGALAATKPKPLGPAPPVVTAHGIPSIAEFNRRLEEAIGAFRQIWGYEPTPGLAFDLTKIDLDGPGYRAFLGGARTPRQATRSAALQKVLALGPPGLGDVTQAAQDYADVQKTLERFAGYQGGPASFVRPPKRLTHEQSLLAGGHGAPGAALAGYDVTSATGLFATQVINNIQGFPGGIALLAKTVGRDFRDVGSEAVRHTIVRGLRAGGVNVDLKQRDVTPGRTAGLVRDSALGMWDMLKNPSEHPGDLFVFGVTMIPAGIGMATRPVFAARAVSASLKAGEGAGAAARALFSRPLPGTFRLGVGTYQANVLLHDNIAYRAVQVSRLRAKQAALESRYGADGTGLQLGDRGRQLSWMFGGRLVTPMGLGPERVLTKAMYREAAIDFELGSALVREVERMARWDLTKESMVNAIFTDRKLKWFFANRNDRLGIEKAIEVLATNDVDPLGLHVRFHERALAGIARGDPEFKGSIPEAHEAQLVALKKAAEILDNPDRVLIRSVPGVRGPVTFRMLYGAVQDMMDRAEELKILYLGLKPETAQQRIVAYAEALRGTVRPADLRPEGLTVPEKSLLTGALTQAPEVLAITKGGKVTVDVGGDQPMILNLTRGQAAYVDRYLAQSRKVDKAQAKFDKARQRYEDSLLPPELEVTYMPGKREMTLDEVKARSAEVTKATAEMWDFMYESIRDALYGSGKGASIEQARANRYGSKRKKLGRDTVTEKVNAEVAKKWRELYDYEGDNPRLIKARDLMREDARLGEILNYESVAAGARFLDEEPPPRPPMPTVEAKRVAVETGETIWQPVRGAAYGRETALKNRGAILSHEKDLLERLAGQMDERLRAKAVLIGDLVKAEERAPYAQGFSPFYLPSWRVVSRGTEVVGTRGPGIRGISAYGVKDRPSPLAELSHEFTGEAIRIGDTRVDTTGYSISAFRKTLRAVHLVKLHKDLWNMGVEFGPGSRIPNGYIAVRAGDQIPETLRRYVTGIDDGSLRASVADSLTESTLDELQHYLFPARGEGGRAVLPSDVPPESVRWVDERLLLETPGQRAYWNQMDKMFTGHAGGLSFALGGGLRLVNEAFRDLNLFLRPAYILNALGAAVQLTIESGFLAPPNLGRAVTARHWLGKDGADAADILSGQTRSAAYVDWHSKINPSEYLYRMWQPLTDLFFRRAALFYELRKRGIRSREDTRKALGLEGEMTPEMRLKVSEASRRAKRAMIDFELNPWEKATLRHIFFVYAFTTRSIVWSMATIVDHPGVTGALAQLGQLNEEELDKLIGPTPSWFDRTGYFPSGVDADGNPLVQNWSQLSVMTTMANLSYPFAGMFADVPYQSIDELFGGAAGFLTHLATGRDENGREYPQGRLVGALKDTWANTSLGTAFARARKQAPEDLGEVPLIGDDRLPTMFTTRESKARELPVFTPDGFESTWGPWLFGGAAPKTVNQEAAAARYWRDAPAADKRAHEVEQIMQGLRWQAKALGRKIPEQVRLAVRVATRVSMTKEAYAKENGHVPVGYEEIRVWVGSLRNEGALSEQEAADYLKRAKAVRDTPYMLKPLLAELQYRSHDGALTAWDASVRALQTVLDPARQAEALDALKRAGIPAPSGMAGADEKTQLAYGRQYVMFLEESDKLKGRVAELAGDAARAARYELLAFESAADKEVTVNGVKFPSPIRVAWALQTEAQRQATIRSLPKASWGELSTFEKALAGKPVEATVQAGWQELERLVSVWERDNAGRRYPTEAKRRLAGELNRDARFRGILVDFDFAYRSRLRRFEVMSVYLTSENRGKWDEILLAARGFEAARKSGQWPVAAVDDAWTRVVNEKIMPWLELPENEAFKAEVDSYGATFLTGMLTR